MYDILHFFYESSVFLLPVPFPDGYGRVRGSHYFDGKKSRCPELAPLSFFMMGGVTPKKVYDPQLRTQRQTIPTRIFSLFLSEFQKKKIFLS